MLDNIIEKLVIVGLTGALALMNQRHTDKQIQKALTKNQKPEEKSGKEDEDE